MLLPFVIGPRFSPVHSFVPSRRRCTSNALLCVPLSTNDKRPMRRTSVSLPTKQPARDPHEKPGRFAPAQRNTGLFTALRDMSQAQKTRWMRTGAIAFFVVFLFWYLSPRGVNVYNGGGKQWPSEAHQIDLRLIHLQQYRKVALVARSLPMPRTAPTSALSPAPSPSPSSSTS